MLNLLFPNRCSGCNGQLTTQKEVICVDCRHNLPLTRFHFTGDTSMKDTFYGRFPLQAATSLLRFQKQGLTQELLHNLKYRGHKNVSSFFGKWLGDELKDIIPYTKATMVIPVPLHKQKLKKRGYNQVEGFGKELAASLAIPYRDDVLLKISKTSSQVFKGRFTRFSGDELFTVSNAETLENQHILLVDDIVTTGATLENCATKLIAAAADVQISIATIAKA